MHMLAQAQITSPHLSQVVFSLSVQSLRCIKSSEYAGLDECLASAHFKELKEALFIYDGPLPENPVKEKMKRVLKQSTARGVVKVSKFVHFPEVRDPLQKLLQSSLSWAPIFSRRQGIVAA